MSSFQLDFLPLAVAMADLNSDGDLDIVTTGLTHGVSVFLGNGDGSFGGEMLVEGGPGLARPSWLTLIAMGRRTFWRRTSIMTPWSSSAVSGREL